MSADRARELLNYDVDTGTLTWRHESRVGFRKSVLMHSAGAVAGTRRIDGRIVLNIDGKTHLGHRIAWLVHTGEWPDGEIDHINGDCGDNRLSNLRSVSRRVNQENKHRAQRNKKSCDLLGAYRNPRNSISPWKACISVDGRQKYIGVYRTAEDAHSAYVQAKRIHHKGCTL